MKITLCEKLNNAISTSEAKMDGLDRLNKKMKGKEKYFVIGEIVSDDDNSEYQDFSSDLRKIEKSIVGLTATTDTEYANDDGFVDDEGDEATDYNYYAFKMPEGDIDLESELKKLDKKYGFYGVWINGKQIKL